MTSIHEAQAAVAALLDRGLRAHSRVQSGASLAASDELFSGLLPSPSEAGRSPPNVDDALDSGLQQSDEDWDWDAEFREETACPISAVCGSPDRFDAVEPPTAASSEAQSRQLAMLAALKDLLAGVDSSDEPEATATGTFSEADQGSHSYAGLAALPHGGSSSTEPRDRSLLEILALPEIREDDDGLLPTLLAPLPKAPLPLNGGRVVGPLLFDGYTCPSERGSAPAGRHAASQSEVVQPTKQGAAGTEKEGEREDAAPDDSARYSRQGRAQSMLDFPKPAAAPSTSTGSSEACPKKLHSDDRARGAHASAHTDVLMSGPSALRWMSQLPSPLCSVRFPDPVCGGNPLDLRYHTSTVRIEATERPLSCLDSESPHARQWGGEVTQPAQSAVSIAVLADPARSHKSNSYIPGETRANPCFSCYSDGRERIASGNSDHASTQVMLLPCLPAFALGEEGRSMTTMPAAQAPVGIVDCHDAPNSASPQLSVLRNALAFLRDEPRLTIGLGASFKSQPSAECFTPVLCGGRCQSPCVRFDAKPLQQGLTSASASLEACRNAFLLLLGEPVQRRHFEPISQGARIDSPVDLLRFLTGGLPLLSRPWSLAHSSAFSTLLSFGYAKDAFILLMEAVDVAFDVTSSLATSMLSRILNSETMEDVSVFCLPSSFIEAVDVIIEQIVDADKRGCLTLFHRKTLFHWLSSIFDLLATCCSLSASSVLLPLGWGSARAFADRHSQLLYALARPSSLSARLILACEKLSAHCQMLELHSPSKQHAGHPAETSRSELADGCQLDGRRSQQRPSTSHLSRTDVVSALRDICGPLSVLHTSSQALLKQRLRAHSRVVSSLLTERAPEREALQADALSGVSKDPPQVAANDEPRSEQAIGSSTLAPDYAPVFSYGTFLSYPSLALSHISAFQMIAIDALSSVELILSGRSPTDTSSIIERERTIEKVACHRPRQSSVSFSGPLSVVSSTGLSLTVEGHYFTALPDLYKLVGLLSSGASDVAINVNSGQPLSTGGSQSEAPEEFDKIDLRRTTSPASASPTVEAPAAARSSTLRSVATRSHRHASSEPIPPVVDAELSVTALRDNEHISRIGLFSPPIQRLTSDAAQAASTERVGRMVPSEQTTHHRHTISSYSALSVTVSDCTTVQNDAESSSLGIHVPPTPTHSDESDEKIAKNSPVSDSHGGKVISVESPWEVTHAPARRLQVLSLMLARLNIDTAPSAAVCSAEAMSSMERVPLLSTLLRSYSLSSAASEWPYNRATSCQSDVEWPSVPPIELQSEAALIEQHVTNVRVYTRRFGACLVSRALFALTCSWSAASPSSSVASSSTPSNGPAKGLGHVERRTGGVDEVSSGSVPSSRPLRLLVTLDQADSAGPGASATASWYKRGLGRSVSVASIGENVLTPFFSPRTTSKPPLAVSALKPSGPLQSDTPVQYSSKISGSSGQTPSIAASRSLASLIQAMLRTKAVCESAYIDCCRILGGIPSTGLLAGEPAVVFSLQKAGGSGIERLLLRSGLGVIGQPQTPAAVFPPQAGEDGTTATPGSCLPDEPTSARGLLTALARFHAGISGKSNTQSSDSGNVNSASPSAASVVSQSGFTSPAAVPVKLRKGGGRPAATPLSAVSLPSTLADLECPVPCTLSLEPLCLSTRDYHLVSSLVTEELGASATYRASKELTASGKDSYSALILEGHARVLALKDHRLVQLASLAPLSSFEDGVSHSCSLQGSPSASAPTWPVAVKLLNGANMDADDVTSSIIMVDAVTAQVLVAFRLCSPLAIPPVNEVGAIERCSNDTLAAIAAASLGVNRPCTSGSALATEIKAESALPGHLRATSWMVPPSLSAPHTELSHRLLRLHRKLAVSMARVGLSEKSIRHHRACLSADLLMGRIGSMQSLAHSLATLLIDAGRLPSAKATLQLAAHHVQRRIEMLQTAVTVGHDQVAPGTAALSIVAVGSQQTQTSAAPAAPASRAHPPHSTDVDVAGPLGLSSPTRVPLNGPAPTSGKQDSPYQTTQIGAHGSKHELFAALRRIRPVRVAFSILSSIPRGVLSQWRRVNHRKKELGIPMVIVEGWGSWHRTSHGDGVADSFRSGTRRRTLSLAHIPELLPLLPVSTGRPVSDSGVMPFTTPAAASGSRHEPSASIGVTADSVDASALFSRFPLLFSCGHSSPLSALVDETLLGALRVSFSGSAAHTNSWGKVLLKHFIPDEQGSDTFLTAASDASGVLGVLRDSLITLKLRLASLCSALGSQKAALELVSPLLPTLERLAATVGQQAASLTLQAAIGEHIVTESALSSSVPSSTGVGPVVGSQTGQVTLITALKILARSYYRAGAFVDTAAVLAQLIPHLPLATVTVHEPSASKPRRGEPSLSILTSESKGSDADQMPELPALPRFSRPEYRLGAWSHSRSSSGVAGSIVENGNGHMRSISGAFAVGKTTPSASTPSSLLKTGTSDEPFAVQANDREDASSPIPPGALALALSSAFVCTPDAQSGLRLLRPDDYTLAKDSVLLQTRDSSQTQGRPLLHSLCMSARASMAPNAHSFKVMIMWVKTLLQSGKLSAALGCVGFLQHQVAAFTNENRPQTRESSHRRDGSTQCYLTRGAAVERKTAHANAPAGPGREADRRMSSLSPALWYLRGRVLHAMVRHPSSVHWPVDDGDIKLATVHDAMCSAVTAFRTVCDQCTFIGESSSYLLTKAQCCVVEAQLSYRFHHAAPFPGGHVVCAGITHAVVVPKAAERRDGVSGNDPLTVPRTATQSDAAVSAAAVSAGAGADRASPSERTRTLTRTMSTDTIDDDGRIKTDGSAARVRESPVQSPVSLSNRDAASAAALDRLLQDHTTAMSSAMELSEPVLLLRCHLNAAELFLLRGDVSAAMSHATEAKLLYLCLFADGLVTPVCRVMHAQASQRALRLLSRLVVILSRSPNAVLQSNLHVLELLLQAQADDRRRQALSPLPAPWGVVGATQAPSAVESGSSGAAGSGQFYQDPLPFPCPTAIDLLGCEPEWHHLVTAWKRHAPPSSLVQRPTLSTIFQPKLTSDLPTSPLTVLLGRMAARLAQQLESGTLLPSVVKSAPHLTESLLSPPPASTAPSPAASGFPVAGSEGKLVSPHRARRSYSTFPPGPHSKRTSSGLISPVAPSEAASSSNKRSAFQYPGPPSGAVRNGTQQQQVRGDLTDAKELRQLNPGGNSGKTHSIEDHRLSVSAITASRTKETSLRADLASSLICHLQAPDVRYRGVQSTAGSTESLPSIPSAHGVGPAGSQTRPFAARARHVPLLLPATASSSLHLSASEEASALAQVLGRLSHLRMLAHGCTDGARRRVLLRAAAKRLSTSMDLMRHATPLARCFYDIPFSVMLETASDLASSGAWAGAVPTVQALQRTVYTLIVDGLLIVFAPFSGSKHVSRLGGPLVCHESQSVLSARAEPSPAASVAAKTAECDAVFYSGCVALRAGEQIGVGPCIEHALRLYCGRTIADITSPSVQRAGPTASPVESSRGKRASSGAHAAAALGAAGASNGDLGGSADPTAQEASDKFVRRVAYRALGGCHRVFRDLLAALSSAGLPSASYVSPGQLERYHQALEASKHGLARLLPSVLRPPPSPPQPLPTPHVVLICSTSAAFIPWEELVVATQVARAGIAADDISVALCGLEGRGSDSLGRLQPRIHVARAGTLSSIIASPPPAVTCPFPTFVAPCSQPGASRHMRDLVWVESVRQRSCLVAALRESDPSVPRPQLPSSLSLQSPLIPALLGAPLHSSLPAAPLGPPSTFTSMSQLVDAALESRGIVVTSAASTLFSVLSSKQPAASETDGAQDAAESQSPEGGRRLLLAGRKGALSRSTEPAESPFHVAPVQSLAASALQRFLGSLHDAAGGPAQASLPEEWGYRHHVHGQQPPLHCPVASSIKSLAALSRKYPGITFHEVAPLAGRPERVLQWVRGLTATASSAANPGHGTAGDLEGRLSERLASQRAAGSPSTSLTLSDAIPGVIDMWHVLLLQMGDLVEGSEAVSRLLLLCPQATVLFIPGPAPIVKLVARYLSESYVTGLRLWQAWERKRARGKAAHAPPRAELPASAASQPSATPVVGGDAGAGDISRQGSWLRLLRAHLAPSMDAQDPAEGALQATPAGGAGHFEPLPATEAALPPLPRSFEQYLRAPGMEDTLREYEAAMQGRAPDGTPLPLTSHADQGVAALPPEWTGAHNFLYSVLSSLRQSYGVSVAVFNPPPPRT